MRFSVIIISAEHFFKEEALQINKLFSEGLHSLHIRKPEAAKAEIENLLLQISPKYYKNIILHSHYELIPKFGLKGAHLTERSKRSSKKISFLKRKKIKIISASFHSIEQINSSRRKYEYVFLSPVFDSISKKGYKSKFDLQKLESVLRKVKQPVIALGGLNEKNISTIKDIGFSGVAAIGSIWKGMQPEKNYKKLVSKIK